MNEHIKSIILGIIQGFTEFLPVSSTAHLRIVPALLFWDDPGTAFSAVIQLGTGFAVVIYFWQDLVKIYGAFFKSVFNGFKFESQEAKLGLWILIGTLPICIFGLLFKDPIEAGVARNLYIVSFYLIFFGIMLLISELTAKQNRTINNINALDVVLIGLLQVFALIPGASRSGVTLFAGLLLGFKRTQAARFSFLLSIPAILASGVLELNTLVYGIINYRSNISVLDLLLGIIFAGISGYVAIDFLLKYLQSHKTHIFVMYRVLLGALVIWLSYNGVIH